MKQIPNKRPKAIITDVDKTLTERTTWLEISEKLGASIDQHAGIFTDFLNDKIDLEETKEQLFKLWRSKGPVFREDLATIVDGVHLRGEAFDTFVQLQERGYKLCLISSSFDLLVEHVAKRFSIENYYSNAKLIFDSNGEWVDFEFDKSMAALKAKQLDDFLNKTGLQKDECIALGDDINDIDIFRKVPGIAIHSHSDPLKAVAWQSINYLPRVIQVLESLPVQ